jgi:hypothetical protein
MATTVLGGAFTPITRWLITDNGVFSPGAKLYTYASGGSTPLATYQTAALTGGAAHTNPVVADAEGVLPAIYLLPNAYRFLVTDASGATIFPAQDDVWDFASYASAQGIATTIIGVYAATFTPGQVVYLSDGSGGNIAGYWYLADADFTYASSLAPQIGVALQNGLINESHLIAVGGRVREITGLTPGAAYYVSATAGGLTSSAPANARLVGYGDISTTLVLTPNTGGVSAGATTQVIYNDGGVLAGDADFTFDKANNVLAIPRVKFPGTQAPSTDVNVLDDYEEGSWTPVLGGDGGTTGQTYSAQVGRYIKIGKQVTAFYFLTLTAKGTITGSAIIAGLPFTAENLTLLPVNALIWSALGTTWVNVISAVVGNTTTAALRGTTVAAVSNNVSLTTADITDTTTLVGSIQYQAAA